MSSKFSPVLMATSEVGYFVFDLIFFKETDGKFVLGEFYFSKQNLTF